MDLSKYYSNLEVSLKSRKALNEFTEFIVLSSYKFELFTREFKEIMLLPENKRDKTLGIALILDICYELYDNYLNYDPSETKRHLFYLIFTTELVRDFELTLGYLIPNETEKIKIFEKFVNREDFEKENILKHILEYLNR